MCISVNAHEFNPAHLIIQQQGETHTYTIDWRYPYKNLGSRAEIVFPSNCTSKKEPVFKQSKYLIELMNLQCQQSLKGQTIAVKNLSVLTDVLVSITHNLPETDIYEGVMNIKQPRLTIPFKKQLLPTSYLHLGIEHLFEGLDHIVFILGLLCLVTGLSNIIKTITAFTLAHSLTLVLAVTNIISLPQTSIEILIALTIIFLAIDIGNKKHYTSTPWLMAFGFGLLHGLGFANVLTEIGINSQQLLLSLLFFNLGIEVGQLTLMFAFGMLLYGLNRINRYNYATTFITYLLGGLGAYWFISRFLTLII